MHSCLKVMRQLADFYQGELSEEEARLVRGHIAKCRYCRLVSDSAKQTLQAFESPFGFEITGQPHRP